MLPVTQNNLRYKLVVSDLDATLLDADSEIPAGTLRQIEEYHRLGGFFTVATGRMEGSAQRFADQLGVRVPIISFNGGKIIDLASGRVIYETFLDAGLAKKAYLAMRALNKDVIVYLDHARYVAVHTPVIDKYIARIGSGVLPIDDIDRVLGDGRELKKLLVIDPVREDGLIFGTVRDIFGGAFNCFKSDPDYYEIMPPDTSKGYALERLAEYLGIPLGETVALGDHINDVPMIRAAGLGVAVANAVPEAIEAADYVTASNREEGVARVVRMIIDGAPFK